MAGGTERMIAHFIYGYVGLLENVFVAFNTCQVEYLIDKIIEYLGIFAHYICHIKVLFGR